MKKKEHNSEIVKKMIEEITPEQKASAQKMAERCERRRWSLFLKILPEEWFNFEPEDEWTPGEFVALAADEAFNRDEFSEEGYVALKFMLFRLVVPKNRWNDKALTRDEFTEMLKEKYIFKIEEK